MIKNRTFKKKRFAYGPVLFILTYATPLFANVILPPPQITYSNPPHYYVGAQTNLAYRKQQSTNVLVSKGGTLTSAANNNTFFDFGVHAGVISQLDNDWSLHWGASYFTNRSQKINGHYYQIPPAQSPDPDASYTYQLKLRRLMIETSLFYKQNNHFSYFTSLSLGDASMHTSAFSFTKITHAITPTVSAQTNSSLAYALSAGLDIAFTPMLHLQAGLKKQWLGTQQLTVQEGSTETKINMGTVNPISAWIGLNCQF
jgi:opacity protein-like surface antigen